MLSNRKIAWIDGVNSAVMGFLALWEDPDLIFAHCDLGDSVHEDSHRFINDLEQWYGREIIRLRSEEYGTIDDVFERREYLSGPHGAPCTKAMKIVPRMNFQVPSDTHLWGYTADKTDAKRAKRMVDDYPLLSQRSPLIEYGFKKRDTHAFLAAHGVRRPYVYEVGMPNGNCIGCVKSSSPNYWSLIRKFFPLVFARRNEQARRFGAKLVILRSEIGPNGKRRNVRCYPDEIPSDWPTTVRNADFGGCGFHCATD